MEEAYVGHVYNLRSKGTPKSNDSPYATKTIANKNTTTSDSTSKQTSTNKSLDKENEKEK